MFETQITINIWDLFVLESNIIEREAILIIPSTDFKLSKFPSP